MLIVKRLEKSDNLATSFYFFMTSDILVRLTEGEIDAKVENAPIKLTSINLAFNNYLTLLINSLKETHNLITQHFTIVVSAKEFRDQRIYKDSMYTSFERIAEKVKANFAVDFKQLLLVMPNSGEWDWPTVNTHYPNLKPEQMIVLSSNRQILLSTREKGALDIPCFAGGELEASDQSKLKMLVKSNMTIECLLDIDETTLKTRKTIAEVRTIINQSLVTCLQTLITLNKDIKFIFISARPSTTISINFLNESRSVAEKKFAELTAQIQEGKISEQDALVQKNKLSEEINMLDIEKFKNNRYSVFIVKKMYADAGINIELIEDYFLNTQVTNKWKRDFLTEKLTSQETETDLVLFFDDDPKEIAATQKLAERLALQENPKLKLFPVRVHYEGEFPADTLERILTKLTAQAHQIFYDDDAGGKIVGYTDNKSAFFSERHVIACPIEEKVGHQCR